MSGYTHASCLLQCAVSAVKRRERSAWSFCWRGNLFCCL